MKLLLLGATGLVGSEALKIALTNNAISEVLAPSRHALEPHQKLVNPVMSRLEDLLPTLASYQLEAVVCTLGTTQAKAGSKAAFRHVDYELPVAFGEVVQAAGTDIFALVSAMGASTSSRSFYYQTKGEVEQAIQGIGFRSLTICRPSLIGGPRHETRRAEGAALALMQFLAPVLPKKLRVNPACVIAASLLDAVIAAKSGSHLILSEEMN